MSRSIRKHTAGLRHSDNSQWKRDTRRTFRRISKYLLKDGKEPLFALNQVSTAWDAPFDFDLHSKWFINEIPTDAHGEICYSREYFNKHYLRK